MESTTGLFAIITWQMFLVSMLFLAALAFVSYRIGVSQGKIQLFKYVTRRCSFFLDIEPKGSKEGYLGFLLCHTLGEFLPEGGGARKACNGIRASVKFENEHVLASQGEVIARHFYYAAIGARQESGGLKMARELIQLAISIAIESPQYNESLVEQLRAYKNNIDFYICAEDIRGSLQRFDIGTARGALRELRNLLNISTGNARGVWLPQMNEDFKKLEAQIQSAEEVLSTERSRQAA